MKKIEILALETIPEIQQGDNLAQIICKCAENEHAGINDKDIIVITSKIVTKSVGATRKIADVKIGEKALKISKKTGKNPLWVQMVLDSGHEIIAVLPMYGPIEKYVLEHSKNPEISARLCENKQCLFITRNPYGQIHTCDAGIDISNHPEGEVGMIPDNPDEKALEIRNEIQKISGKKIAMVIADTELTFCGTIDMPIGVSGINPCSMMFGQDDSMGKPKFGGFDLIGQEITSAAALLFGQTNENIPAGIIRGCEFEFDEKRNVSNTLQLGSKSEILKIISETMRLTSYAIEGCYKKMLLRIGAFFIR